MHSRHTHRLYKYVQVHGAHLCDATARLVIELMNTPSYKKVYGRRRRRQHMHHAVKQYVVYVTVSCTSRSVWTQRCLKRALHAVVRCTLSMWTKLFHSRSYVCATNEFFLSFLDGGSVPIQWTTSIKWSFFLLPICSTSHSCDLFSYTFYFSAPLWKYFIHIFVFFFNSVFCALSSNRSFYLQNRKKVDA